MVNFVRLREGGFLRPWRRIFQTLVQRLSSPGSLSFKVLLSVRRTLLLLKNHGGGGA
jgi:hypothetical protein